MTKFKQILIIFIFFAFIGLRNSYATPSYVEDIRIEVELEPITQQNISRLTEVAFTGTGNVNDIVWISNGEQIAVAGSSGLWLFNTENLLENPLRLSNHRFLTIAYANTETVNILVGADLVAGILGVGDPIIQVWDTDSYEIIYMLDSPIGSHILELNHDGSLLLAGDTRRDVHLYDMNNGDLINTITNIGPIPSSFAFLPDQNAFTVGGVDSSQLVLWAISEFRQAVYTVDEPSNAVAYDPNNDLLVTISGDTLRIRGANEMNLMQSIEGFSDTNSITFSADGVFLAQQDLEATHLWRTTDLLTETNPVPIQSLPIAPFAISPDSSMIALYNANKLSIWEIDGELFSETQFNPLCENVCTPIEMISLENNNLIIDTVDAEYSISFDFDGNEGAMVASSGNFSVQYTEAEETYTVFTEDGETNNTEIILPENLQRRYLFSPTLSPNEDLIVAGSYDGLYFWDAETGDLLHKEIASDIENIFFSDDSSLLFSYGRGNPSLRIWGIPTD